MKNEAKKNMEMNKPFLNLDIDDQRWEEELPNIGNLCDDILQKTFSFLKEQSKNELVKQQISLSINLMLSNDEVVQKLNFEFRGKNKPTNVLSFANVDDPDFGFDVDDTDGLELGDVVIALETLKKEAKLKEISLKDHFSHLWVHGILHILGYDHMNDDDADEMENLEILILDTLNITNPYADIDNA